MRNFLSLFIIILLSANCIFSQNKFSSSVEIFKNDIAKEFKKENLEQSNSGIKEKYPIYKQNNIYYVSALAEKGSDFSKEKLEKSGIIIGSEIGNFMTLRVPIIHFFNNHHLAGIKYLEIANKVQSHLDRALTDSRADSVHMAWMMQQAFTGKNVLIGITDWGFDYTHPMFYDTTLTQTRIVKAWDQFRNQGPAPQNFTYGTEFIGSQQLLSAECDTFNIYQYATHGSHVAGIAGGSGAGTKYRGVAFESEFLFATFLIDAAAVIDAFNWMKQYAQSVGKRLVINTSWGLYYIGNLDGTSILSQIIDQLSNEGVVFVSSAGNNGNVDFHIKKTFSAANDTLRTYIGFDNYAYYSNMWGQSITMWGSANSSFEFSVKIYNQQNQKLAETPLYNTLTNQYFEDTLIVGNDTIRFNFTADSSNHFNQRPHIRLRVQNKNTTLRTALFVTSEQSTVHLWNVIELTNGVGNWGSAFWGTASGWTAGDKYYGIGEPACAESVISVAAHAAEYQLVNGNWTGGNIASFSSFGPIMDERIKPDISAPGQNVASSISSFTSQTFNSMNIVTNVDFNGRNYKFVRFSGTSMSSPMVAGIVALMLEANPNLTPQQIKDIIKNTARQDSKTGAIPPLGSTRWGKGKIDALKAIYEVLGIVYIQEHENNNTLQLFPNPAINLINISNFEVTNQNVYIIDNSGKIVFQEKNITNNQIDVSQLPSGNYFLLLKSENNYQIGKFIKL